MRPFLPHSKHCRDARRLSSHLGQRGQSLRGTSRTPTTLAALRATSYCMFRHFVKHKATTILARKRDVVLHVGCQWLTAAPPACTLLLLCRSVRGTLIEFGLMHALHDMTDSFRLPRAPPMEKLLSTHCELRRAQAESRSWTPVIHGYARNRKKPVREYPFKQPVPSLSSSTTRPLRSVQAGFLTLL